MHFVLRRWYNIISTVHYHHNMNVIMCSSVGKIIKMALSVFKVSDCCYSTTAVQAVFTLMLGYNYRLLCSVVELLNRIY